MKPFNLAESRIVEREYCHRHINRRLRVIAALVVLTVCVAAASCACRMLITDKESHAISHLADAQGRCAEVKKEMAALKSSLSHRDWQEQLAGSSAKQLAMLGYTLQHLPRDVWLNRIESSSKDSVLNVAGHALSYASLSAYLGALRRCPAFSDVRLGSTRVTSLRGQTVVGFDLQAALPAPAGAQAPAPVGQAGQVPPIQEPQ